MIKAGTKVTIPDITKLEPCIQEFYTSGVEYTIVGNWKGNYEVSDDSDEDYWYIEEDYLEVVEDEK